MIKLKGHPNIITLMDYEETKDKLYLIMEYCRGGELLEKLHEKEVFTEAEAWSIISQVLAGVHYCHKNNIVHW